MSSVPEYIQWRLGKSDPVFPTSEERLFKYADYGSEQKCEGDPILVVLNFSGGKQSSAILWMVLLGDIPRPDNFLVLHADPGMENRRTYEYVEMMFEECSKQGISAFTVDGPNLYEDLTRGTTKTRIDNPPYWTVDEDGDVGKLMQKCTKAYKIEPMDKALREWMECEMDIKKNNCRLGYGVVEKWIGFSFDEMHRVKGPRQKYQRFGFPLIDLKMTNADVVDYFLDNDLPIPPRSVCNACFANGLKTLRQMYEERPEDWEQAVRVDRSIRDMSAWGVDQTAFVSRTTMPLEELARRGFDVSGELEDDDDDYSCDSGFCFV